MLNSRWNDSMRKRLRTFASRFVRTNPVFDASDIVNSAIVTAYRNRSQFLGKTDAEFHAWLRTIVQNKYKSRVRSELALRRGGGQHEGLSTNQRLDVPSREKPPELQASDREVEQLLAELLQQIGEEHAELLYLANYCDYSHSEIAEQFGLTKNQVTGRLRTAKKRMHDAMQELGLDESAF